METKPLPTGTLNCQMSCLPRIADSKVDREVSLLPLDLFRYGKVMLKRTLSPKSKRKLKSSITNILERFYLLRASFIPHSKQATDQPAKTDSLLPGKLQADDRVRIRSKSEIQSTLNIWNEHKHCGFFPEMEQYCETEQYVFKTVERFVDERDYRVKRSHGVVLLRGVICQGTEFYGRCDRACFYFWREEWLQKIE